MARSRQQFGDALLDMIMSADDDVQKEFRAAYEATISGMIISGRSMRNAPPFTRDVFDACKEAFELIDEVNGERPNNPPAHKANAISLDHGDWAMARGKSR